MKALFDKISKLGGLDLSRRDLDRDLDLDAQKVSVSTVEKVSLDNRDNLDRDRDFSILSRHHHPDQNISIEK